MKAGSVAVVAAFLALAAQVHGQGRGAPPADSARQTPRAAAPVDLTGYWVSVITEDWRYRMVTPTKGDYQGVPMTAEARRIADGWKPEADEAAGEQCKSHGAPASLRLPGRIHFAWQDDRTLRLELDAGTQTRLLRFEPPQTGRSRPSWQGESTARWEALPAGRAAAQAPTGGWLKVTTTNLRAGYLRKNGVPYSEAAVLTEYLDLGVLPDGTPLLVVTAIVDDPRYLAQPFVVSSQFKKEADGSRWEPTPCSSTW